MHTLIIMKKVIYLILFTLIANLAIHAQEKTGEWNGCDRYDFTFKDRQQKEIPGYGGPPSSMLFQV